MDRTRFLALPLLLFPLACDPPPPDVPENGAPVPTTQANSGVMPSDPGGGSDSQYDTSPVEAPGEVVFHLRWSDPAATIDASAELAKMPLRSGDTQVQAGIRELMNEVFSEVADTERLAEAIHLEAPIDVVAIVNLAKPTDEPGVAISVGLRSVQAALAASKGRPKEMGPGAWRIGTKERWAEPCAVVAAAGEAPGRLICTERERDLAKLAPFVARNVAALPDFPADFHAEVKFRSVLDKFGREWAAQVRGLPVLAEDLKIGNPKFDDALRDAADALAAEAADLIFDADSIMLDIDVDATRGITGGLSLTFADNRSWLVQTISDGAEQAGPPPPIFWKLPEDSVSAAYGRTLDPARFDKVFALGRALGEGALEKEKIGNAADRQAMVDLLRLPIVKHKASVRASGTFPPAAGPKTMKGTTQEYLGWNLFGYDHPAGEMKKYLEDMVKVYNRPTLQAEMKKALGSDAKHLPTARVVPSGLGAGSLGIQITVPQLDDPVAQETGKGPKTFDLDVFILLMEADGQTWLAAGADKNQLVQVLKDTKAGKATLAARSEWSMLKSQRHSSAYITTLAGLISSFEPVIALFADQGPSGAKDMAAEIRRVINSMPNKGSAPITVSGDTTAGGKPKATVAFNLPKATLEDLGFLVRKGVEMAAQAGAAP